MKELNEFLYDAKPEKPSTPHNVKSDEGENDAQYMKLMGEYKKNRNSDYEGAHKTLEKALKLAQDGKVSHDAQVMAAYL